ncbi:MAG: transcription antitermination protein NusB [Desulfomicrobiaceae bacterium]|nr:transcription antitermination protein NusB [Desulfomicrobiaceae bacterium]
MKQRQRERRFALQLLYALHFHPTLTEADLARAFDNFRADAQCPDLEREGSYAWELVRGVWQHHEDLDAIIAQHATGWKLSRIATVERAILRLALFEMRHTNLPFKVAVNEAVELAKAFGEEGSRVFVNGVLDAAGKALSRGEAACA